MPCVEKKKHFTSSDDQIKLEFTFCNDQTKLYFTPCDGQTEWDLTLCSDETKIHFTPGYMISDGHPYFSSEHWNAFCKLSKRRM